jgi:hypothetical protein
MDDARAARMIEIVLRCYPASWRRRHGDEAAELAALLITDGTPAGSIALSYLAGAARERLTPRPAWRLTAVACALFAVCSLSVSAGLLASAGPASAASTSHAHGRAHCRPGSPKPVPRVTRAASRPQAVIWEAGHGRSC